jgi:DNA repair exonuclease SbcCD nuclease subunit
MKVAIITDTHWGARNDSLNFTNFMEKFYKNVFFPILDQRKIDTVLMLGDTFDRRKYINFVTYSNSKRIYFDELYKRNIKTHIIVGNHDTSYKNTNEINSVDLLLREYDNVHVIDEPETIDLQGTTVCMVPWICSDNYEQSMEYMKNDKSEICMGHFEIQGFSMYKGMESHEGFDRTVFDKFDMVFSGHYHHKSSDGHIYYLGNPYELTWSDYNDPRGFHIFDTETRELEFIQNPNSIFYKINYDDTIMDAMKYYTTMELDQFKDTYVKIIVANKTNPFLFDMFLNNLYKVTPIDVSIVEDIIDLTEGVEDDIITNAEDTLTILNKYVDNIELPDIDNTKLKGILKSLYVEALNLENV